MSISKKQALARGEKAIERPKGEMEITLYHGNTGLTLRYQGKVIAKTPASAAGKQIAPYVAAALGVKLPALGSAAKAVVSSGVMFRVLSISTMDLKNEESRILLDYLMSEAREMREFQSSEA